MIFVIHQGKQEWVDASGWVWMTFPFLEYVWCLIWIILSTPMDQKAIECYIYKRYGYMNCKKKTKKNEEQSQAALLASSLIFRIAL